MIKHCNFHLPKNMTSLNLNQLMQVPTNVCHLWWTQNCKRDEEKVRRQSKFLGRKNGDENSDG